MRERRFLLASLVGVIAAEIMGIRRRNGATISALTADVFRVRTRAGRLAFTALWGCFAAWYAHHICDVQESSLMACSRGCCETQRDHFRSIAVSTGDKSSMTRSVIDDHDTHTVEVKEHWNDRQDVTVRPRTHKLRLTQED